MFIYLSAEDILIIHDETIEQEGGCLGVPDMGLLYSVAERPKMSMMGQEFYPDLFSKSAAILEGLATYYVFADANKRTAFLACTTFLELNSYELIAPNNTAFKFVLDVATKKKSIEEIVKWLKKYAKKI